MSTTPDTAPVTTRLIRCYPAGYVTAAKDAVAKAWARIVRAAAKSGAEALNPPTLTASEPYVDSRTDEITGLVTKRLVVDIEITTATPKLDGYEFLAVIEPLDGGNLVNRVPGSSDYNLDAYRVAGSAGFCDHCKTNRKRTETFVLLTPASTPIQVGRNCLADFLGGKSPAHILFLLTVETIVREEGEAGGGGWNTPVYDPATVLAWTSGAIREVGWTSAAKARDTEGQSTANYVKYLLARPFGDGKAIEDWVKDVAAAKPTEADTTKAPLVLAWAKSLTGSDYASNLSLIAAQVAVEGKHFGLLCSAVASWEREQGKLLTAKSTGPSVHVGTVGGKLEVTVTVERVIDLEGNYGVSHLHSLKDAAGNVYVWVTGSVRYDVGKTVTLKGTVKAHTDYKGLAQTNLTRCSELDEVVTVAREVVAKPKRIKKLSPAELELKAKGFI